MIRIKPYTDLPEHEEIKQLYLKLVARALPFREDDMAGDKSLFPAGLFNGEKSRKGSPPSPKESRECIKEYSKTLYNYLFDSSEKLKRESLHKLLFSPMDKPSLERNALDEIAVAKDKNERIPIQQVFSYDRFSSSAQFHRFVQMLGVNVCPYCNRSFTTTIAGKKSKKTRPELDHYRSKSNYPFFALSIMNLVPSCGTCNKLKSYREDRVLYPYTEGMGSRYRFKTSPKENGSVLYVAGVKEEFNLKLAPVGKEDEHTEAAKASIKVFGLEELYEEAHRDFVSDMFFQRYVFTDQLLDELCNQFSGLFESKEELKRILYLRGIREEEWGERPLSKLVHDIDLEITELYSHEKE